MHVEDDVEAISNYTSGGFALIEPGMVLGKRYEVVDKLGHGNSATVWLCCDHGTKRRKMQWVAIKVLKATLSSKPSHEMEKKKHLIRRGGKEKEWSAAHVGMPIGEFRHDDVNGSHRCLVMPVLGPSLESRGLADRPALKDHLYATALAVEYLHHHGVAHGQVGPHNVRWQLDFQDAKILSSQDMKDRLGLERRKRTTNTPRPHQPGLLIPSADLGKLAPKGRIVLFPSSTGPTDPAGVLHWYWGPEVLTGLGFLTGIEYRDRPGGDVWSFCCLVLDLYARCTLGVADAGASDAHLWRHVQTLERFLGPFRRPTAFLADERGHFVDRVPSGRMCESEADYARWKRSSLGKLPAGTTALEALLGSDRFRASWAPEPIEREAVLPGPEAGELAAMLESALCYDEGERFIQVVFQSGWFSDLRSRGTNSPIFVEMTPSLAEYDTIKPEDNSGDSAEPDADLAPVPDPATEPKTSRPHLQITKTSNPLLEFATLDVTRTDIFDLLDITRDVVVPADEVLIQTPPARKIKEAKQVLEDARKSKTFAKGNYTHLLDEFFMAVCRAYRDHGERVLTRARALAVRAGESEAYDDKVGYARCIDKVARLTKEYARYRAERVEFYRQELRDSKISDLLRQKMLSEFPDLQDGELDPEDPPSQQQAESSISYESKPNLAEAMKRLQLVSKKRQEIPTDEAKDRGRSASAAQIPADDRPIEGILDFRDVPPSPEGPVVRDGFLYPRDPDNDPFPSPIFSSRVAQFRDFFGEHLNPNPRDIADIPSIPFHIDLPDGDPSTTSEIDSEEEPHSPWDAMAPPCTPSETAQPLAAKNPVLAAMVTEEAPVAPREMQTDTDMPGQETPSPNADLDEVIETDSETLLSAASGSTSPTDSSPDTEVVFTERVGEEVPELIFDHVKVVLSAVEGFVEPHLQKLRGRLESGDPVVYYVLIVCAAGILALCILLFVLVVRARETTPWEPIRNTTSSEVQDWLRTRVVSPYSELHEGLCQSPSCQGETNGGNSTDGGNSLMSYLVTHFAKLP